jgi:hypothetical protein
VNRFRESRPHMTKANASRKKSSLAWLKYGEVEISTTFGLRRRTLQLVGTVEFVFLRCVL